ncbi:60Kd inner membrane protein-domain-containing protein, partial [Auriculariales sp. MPI-PUGE-AT-0066]
PFELGHIREVGLGSFFTPVGWAQNIIEATGALTGLPAWATLAVVTITGRMLILPLLINTQKEAVKLQLVQPKITAVQQQMAAERAEGSITAMSSQQHMVEIQKIYASVGYKMSRAMGGAVSQLLFSASFFLGVRAMANVPIEQLTYGSGALWFQDLSAVDPYYILPALATISFVGMMRMAATDAPPNERFPNLFNGMTLFTGMSFLFLANLPAALCFQMACNGVFGLFQSSLLRIPSFRKLVGLAPRVVYTPRSMRESLTDWRGGWGRLQEANRLAQEGEAQKRRKNRF